MGEAAVRLESAEQLRVTEDRVLVLPDEPEDTYRNSGLIIPDSAKRKPFRGRAVAVGPGARMKDGGRKPMEVEVGDRVVYQKYAGLMMLVGGVEHWLMREGALLAKLEE